MENDDFLNQNGDYHSLNAYKKAECIYDITSINPINNQKQTR